MSANQSRHRIPPPEPAPSTKFTYEPLDPDVHCMRLLRIEPATNKDDHLVCKLTQVTFQEKPKFSALSYMWGDETNKFKICLNGAEFDVGRNLWDALCFLRSHYGSMCFWIDAICIDQESVMERNRQLRIMHHIYFRADRVVVWLGDKYSKYNVEASGGLKENRCMGSPGGLSFSPENLDGATPPGKSEESISPGLESPGGPREPSARDSQEKEMVHALISDEYWDRLWIIQEIGRARRIQVCFGGNRPMDWVGFIDMITHHGAVDGPLRLNKQLQERYSGGHTMRKLLETNRMALCKEPRDKVYGLIGLALDAGGFEMDYRKSLLEVWTDTMVFMNRRRLFETFDVVPFGRLIKSMVIGKDRGPLEQIQRLYEPHSNSTPPIIDRTRETQDAEVFQLDAYIIGCITTIGPSLEEIVGSLEKTDQWTRQIQENFRDDLGNAHRENDALMNAILDMDGSHVETCFNHISRVRWKDGSFSPDQRRCYSNVKGKFFDKIENLQLQSSKKLGHGECSPSKSRAAVGQSSLIQIINPWLGPQGTRWKLGVAAAQAQPGDLICLMEGIEKGILLRIVDYTQWQSRFQVVGTAMLTEDIVSTTAAAHNHRTQNRLEFFQNEKDHQLEIFVDASTIYVLLA